ncbi:MAG: hypothetical protein AB8G99_25080, partial [Planctomycetaceae bacterium]
VESFPMIVAELKDSGSRRTVEPLIIAAGERMEQSVLDELKQTSDHFTLKSMIKILSQIGTAKSIEPLEEIARSDRSRIVAREAQNAIKTIRAR